MALGLRFTWNMAAPYGTLCLLSIPVAPQNSRLVMIHKLATLIKMMKIIRRLHEVVEEVRAVMRAEVGSEMRKAIPKQLSKAGSTVVEKEAAAVIMMTTIIKDLRVVVAEVQAVGKAEVGLAMKEDIPGRLGKVGEIVIKFLK